MSTPIIRLATETDLPAIVRLLADDFLGAGREDVSEPLAEGYLRAFREILASDATDVFVLEVDGRVVGTMQLIDLPCLSDQGTRRLGIEAVRVDSSLRSQGYGELMIRWAIDTGRDRGCGLVQLSSNKQRTRAHSFYKRLGFKNSHEGFKLSLG
ncbi:MAG: GNAT family N-acetyltransferase [Dehalococcoidia bacterium]